ncbi:MAG: hypothetical protein H6Q14_1383 [Bacteroidetes bacterium]|nr:hypothetical protein [Bacteroidota bacterium]
MRYDEDYLNDQFEKLLTKIDSHFAKFSNNMEFADDPIIDNFRFLQLMNISAKTAQSWRDKGIIGFSQIGNKIYYRVSDIRTVLDKHHKQSI